MKKIFWTVMLCIGCTAVGAQASIIEGDSVRVFRMAQGSSARRMADKLMLDDRTSEKFMTLYESYLKELKDAGDRNAEAGTKPEAMTDAQISKQIEQGFEVQQKKLDIRKKYYKKFSSILTPKQTYELFHKTNMNRRIYPFPGMRPKVRMYIKGKNARKQLDSPGDVGRIIRDNIPVDSDRL